MFRPEDVIIGGDSSRSGNNLFPATVEDALFVGSRFQCQVSINTHRIHGEVSKTRVVEVGQTSWLRFRRISFTCSCNFTYFKQAEIGAIHKLRRLDLLNHVDISN